MIVADLPRGRLRQLLAGPGIRVRTGPLVSCIRSPLAAVADGLGLIYAGHPVEPETAYADFHVSVERPRSLRRWYQPQVVFRFDGKQAFHPLPGHQGVPLLEWGLNWCVYTHCHQYLTLHAAVVEREGRALVMPAPSGSGKSTLCAALAFRGWRLLSDELAAIDLDTRAITPLPRPISLKNQSIAVIGGFAPQAVMSPTVADTTKGAVAHVRPPPDAVAQAGISARARWVVTPRYLPGAPAHLRAVPRSRGFLTLMQAAFNYSVHGQQGFEALADIIDGCTCHEFTYGDLEEAMAVFDRLHDGRAACLP